METPLTPLDFARRLYADREAVVDGSLRFTYCDFFDRCDRWSATLQKLGVQPGERVATIAPNTHSHLEAFYAVPQIGAASVEVEGTLLRHPAVQEAAVVGLPHEKWGETPQAFIVLKPGAETTPEALRLFCREHLAGQ